MTSSEQKPFKRVGGRENWDRITLAWQSSTVLGASLFGTYSPGPPFIFSIHLHWLLVGWFLLPPNGFFSEAFTSENITGRLYFFLSSPTTDPKDSPLVYAVYTKEERKCPEIIAASEQFTLQADMCWNFFFSPVPYGRPSGCIRTLITGPRVFYDFHQTLELYRKTSCPPPSHPR